MKTPALQKFRQKLQAGEPVHGLWVTLESASITEMAVGLGLDWVVVDVEHGHLDYRDILEHVRATVRSDTVILIRILELDQGIIKRCLDIGADGILIPWVETAEQLRQGVAFARYPLEGVRGIGGERATCWGQCLPEHVKEANENVLVIPIIESVRGVDNLPEMLNVPGVEVFFFGPSDYSASAGYAGQWEGPGVAERLLAAKDRILGAGRHCGVIAVNNANLQQRLDQGFRMIALGLDGGLLIRSMRDALKTVGKDRRITPGLTSADTPVTAPSPPSELQVTPPSPRTPAPAGRSPENHDSDGSPEQLAPGVTFRRHLGPDSGAAGLTAGLVTFQPGAVLPYHSHDFPESVTLLTGRALVEAEGRMYQIEPFESVTFPAGVAHSATNRSNSEPALFHIAMVTGEPATTPVGEFFSRRAMSADIAPPAGKERVFRLGLS